MRRFRPYAIYIIVEDGRCAYFRPFSENAPPPDLVSAMLTAMQGFVKEVTGSHFSELTAGPFSFTSEKVGAFSVVVVSNKSPLAAEKAKYLSLRFIKRFREIIEEWTGDTFDFQSFDEDVFTVIPNSESIRIDPSVPLDAITLLTLKSELQETAKYLLTKGETTVAELSRSLSIPMAEAEASLEQLHLLGHVGKYDSAGDMVYFIH